MSGNWNQWRGRRSPDASEDEDDDYDYSGRRAHSPRSQDSDWRGSSGRSAASNRRGNSGRNADSNRRGNSAEYADSDEYDYSDRHSARSQEADRYRDSDRRGSSGRYADSDNYRRKNSQYKGKSDSESSDESDQGGQPHPRRYGSSAHSQASRRSLSEPEEEDNQWLVDLLAREPKYQTKLLNVIKKGLPLNELENMIQENAHIFREADECVLLRPQIKICSWHLSPRGCSARSSYKCTDLHICLQYISGSCRSSSCSKGHDLGTAHNLQVLEPYYLRYIDVGTLKKILQISLADIENEEDNGPLILCENYNRGKCSDKKCKHLHFCKYHLESRLRCRGRNCTLNHYFGDPVCNDLLEKRGIDTNESPKDLMNEIFRLFPDLDKANRQPSRRSNPSRQHHSPSSSPSPSPPRQRKAPATGSHLTIEASELEGNLQIPEICSKSLKNKCNTDSCQRLHSDLPFHWQVSVDGHNWFNLHKYQIVYLEKDFSDPSKTRSVLPEPKGWSVHKKLLRILGTRECEADFEDMQVNRPGSRPPLQLRHISLERDGNADKLFLWYFKDGNDRWVKYGDVDTTQRTFLKSSITSENIEQQFLRDPQRPMTFKNDLFTYELDFINMTQTNRSTKVAREVRRRPTPPQLSLLNTFMLKYR